MCACCSRSAPRNPPGGARGRAAAGERGRRQGPAIRIPARQARPAAPEGRVTRGGGEKMPAGGRGASRKARPGASEVSARKQVLVEHRGRWFLRAVAADTAEKFQVRPPAPRPRARPRGRAASAGRGLPTWRRAAPRASGGLTGRATRRAPQVELPAGGGQPGGARREWIPKTSTRVRCVPHPAAPPSPHHEVTSRVPTHTSSTAPGRGGRAAAGGARGLTRAGPAERPGRSGAGRSGRRWTWRRGSTSRW